MLRDVMGDQAHCDLAAEMLRAAGAAHNIVVEDVNFGSRDAEAGYSWLCYVADPAAENRAAGITPTSAVDHLKRYDPGGILGCANSKISATIFDLETSDEASFVLIGANGQDVLTSPWQQHLIVTRATFSFRRQE